MTAAPDNQTTIRGLDWLLRIELVILTFLLGCFLDKDADIWWHLRAGREILAGGGVPRTDSYLFGATGADWIDLHWGFQAAAAWVFNHGGVAALTVAAAGAAACAIMLALAATTRGRPALAAVWCWLPAVFVMSARFYPRPETVSLIFLAAVLAILHEATARPRLLWLLVPILAVWVNVHALFVLGLVMLGCWLVDRGVDSLVFKTRHDWRLLALVTLAAVGATFFNPYTWKGVLFPLRLFTRMSTERGFYAQHIGELASVPALVMRTGINSVYLRLSFLLLGATAVSFALMRRRSLLVFRLLLFLAFGGLGLLASRNQPQFAIVAGAVLAWNISDWLAGRPDPPFVERAAARILTSAVLVGLMLWVVTGRFYKYAGEGRLAGLGEHPFWYAHDAAMFASRAGMPRQFVAYHEGQAAVLEFHMRPDQKVFVDPRLEVSPRDALQQYYALAQSMARREPEWPGRLLALPQPLGMLVDHGTHHAIEAALLTSDRWRCVWFDAVAGVYVPAGEATMGADDGVDFGARYFSTDRTVARVSPAQAESFYKVGRDLVAPGANSSLGRLLLLLAAASIRETTLPLTMSSASAQLVAGTSLGLFGYPDAKTSIRDWQPESTLAAARARYVLNAAVSQTPADFQSWLGLLGIAQALGDPDAVWFAGTRLAALHAANSGEFEVQRQTQVVLRNLMALRAAEPPLALPVDAAEIMTVANELVDRHRFVRALNLLERSVGYGAGSDPPSWEFQNLRASLFLLSGDPRRARAVWSEEDRPEHRADVARHLANVAFVEGRVADAAAAYRDALDRGAPEPARYGLALALLEQHDAAGFITECDAAARSGALATTAADFCRDMRSTVAPYADVQPQRVPRASGGSVDKR